MKYLLLVIVSFTFGCVPDLNIDSSNRGYLKRTQRFDADLKWFSYSSAYSNAPEYVTLETDKSLDTICIATNITDVILRHDTIEIYSMGPLKLYDQQIDIKSRENWFIKLDSSFTNPPKPRRSFHIDRVAK